MMNDESWSIFHRAVPKRTRQAALSPTVSPPLSSHTATHASPTLLPHPRSLPPSSPFQGVIVFLVAQLGLIGSAEEAADLQNVLICFEMALGALGFMVAFPFKPFKLANVGEQAPLLASVKHALTFSDVVTDTVHLVRGREGGRREAGRARHAGGIRR